VIVTFYLHTCCSQLCFSCLFIMLISYLMSTVYLVIILCTLYICTCTSLNTHAHSLGHFLMTLNLYVQILDTFLYCSGVCWARTLREKLEFLPFWFQYPYPSCLPLFLRLFFDSYISVLASIPFFISCVIMCGHLYIVLQWSWFILVDFSF